MIKKAKNVLAFYNSLVYNNIVCRYSSSVECQLPKLERGVRFPLPAFLFHNLSDNSIHLYTPYISICSYKFTQKKPQAFACGCHHHFFIPITPKFTTPNFYDVNRS